MIFKYCPKTYVLEIGKFASSFTWYTDVLDKSILHITKLYGSYKWTVLSNFLAPFIYF